MNSCILFQPNQPLQTDLRYARLLNGNPVSCTKIMSDLHLENYVVIFLDVLGQRDRLRGLTHLPTNPEEEAETVKVIKSTMGTVLRYREMRDNYINELDKKRVISDGAPPILRRMLEADHRVTSYSLSDALVFAVPMGILDGPHAPFRSLLSVMLAACGFMNTSLAAGYPLRGGIEFAPAILNDNEIFGAALADAYELESKYAEYPRVAVGPRLVEFLATTSKSVDAEDLEVKLVGRLAEQCLSLTVTDTDGRIILDSFGQGVKSMMEDIPLTELIDQALEFAKAEYEKFDVARNEKLKSRYYRLIQYLLNRKESWNG